MLEMINKFNWVLPDNLQKIDGRPPLYSQNRQELCEALPYFRSYQGGNYVSKERTMGYLLDGCPSPRDVFEDSGKVIISHAGGGSRMIRAGLGGGPPELTLVKSQKREGYLVQGLINCQLNNLPIVLLAGKKFSGMPWIQTYDSVGYAVLGFYLVTHSWPEKEYRRDQPHKYCIRFKFRFQWVSSQGDPWWMADMKAWYQSTEQLSMKADSNSNWARAPRETSPALSDRESQSPSDGAENDDDADEEELNGEELDDEELDDEELDEEDGVTSTSDGQPESDDGIMDWEATDQICDDSPDEEDPEDVDSIEYNCDTCGEKSLKIYRARGCVLMNIATNFSRETEQDRPPMNSDTCHGYEPPRLARIGKAGTLTTKTTHLQKLSDHQLEFAAHQESKTGFYCSSCGRLSIRVFWRALICSNEHCQFRVDFAVSSPLNLSHLPSGYGKRRNTTCDINSLHAIQSFKIPHYSVRLYRFLHDAGDVIHAIPNDDLSRSGADALFHQILNDVDPISFKRNKIKSHKIDGHVAQAFTFNCGKPYKYCTEVETKSWGEVPGSIISAFTLLQDFNELLSCFYLAGSGMNFHSDNEHGLGSVVGSLSLGSAALMSFKRKIPMQPLDNDTRPSNPPVLELMVGHGDIVLQSGSKLQDKYLHAVKTDGLRISATARCINTDMMR
ncbi:hypothetical protein PSHT_15377 [Puccinia striiformis]|uniref:Fe2OG dioxygenase domain-containing protein n=1 Tax=Puccinia striiformis TaxID=27350 RepID=A0A2S4UFD3_9BASI|nr:hypothetical protein PSHT_15377 [Puccinia striiformis]